MKLEKTLLKLRQSLARARLKPISSGKLANGMRFYTQSDPSVHVAGVGVRVGSVHDPAPGMFHLIEHILSRRTKEENSRTVDLCSRAYGLGPRKSINITTWFTATTYLTDMMINRNAALNMFKLFSGMVKYRDFTQSDLEIERAAVLNEYFHHGEDDMENTIFQLLHRVMYESNPVRNRIDCEPDALKSITLTDVRKSVDAHYVPNNMFAVVLGPRLEEARELVESEFGHLKSRPLPSLKYDFSETLPTLSGIKSIEVDRKGIHLYHVGIGFPTDSWGTKGEEAIDVLTEILSFRVENILRDKNRKWGEGTYHPFAYAYRTSFHGMLYIWYETPSESFAKEAEAKIIHECEQLKSGGLLEEDIKEAGQRITESKERQAVLLRIKQRRRKGLREEWQAMQTLHFVEYIGAFHNMFGELADLIVDAACNAPQDIWEAHEEMRWLNDYRAYLRVIKPRQIIEAANKYLTTPDRYVRIVIRPVDPNPPLVINPRIILPGESRDWRFD